MKARSASDDVGLTPVLLAEICPVARSDRRKYHDLFADLGSEEALKDDMAFYSALFARIRTDDAFLRRFDDRFSVGKSEKEKKKSFGVRALRWLNQRTDQYVDLEDVSSLPEDHFEPSSPESELLLLLRVLCTSAPDEAPNPELGEPVEAEGAEWQAVRSRLRAMLEAFEAPDPVRAAEICAEAEVLAEACAAAAEAAEEKVRVATMRQDLTDRLFPLHDLDGVEILIAGVGTAGMAALETLASALDGLLALHQSLVLAESAFAEKKAEYEEATRSENWSKISIVSGELAGLKEQRAKAISDLVETLSAAQALIDVVPKVADEFVTPSDTQAETPATESELSDSSTVRGSPDPTPELDQPTVELARVTHGGEAHVEPVTELEGLALASGEVLAADSAGASDRVGHRVAKTHDTQPVPWGGAETLDQTLARFLEEGEYALAWHLADLAAERGFVPVLPAPALKALASASAVVGPYDAAAQRVSEALAGAMAGVAEAEALGDERASEKVRAIVFAALLRPALLAPDTTARAHLSNLSTSGGLSAYGALRSALAGLGHEFHPSAGDLAELVGSEQERRLPSMKTALATWLVQARLAQSMHTPTNVILHQLLAPQGKLGRVIETALAGNAGADHAARQLIQDLFDDRGAQERLIADSENDMGRPRRARIRGTALDWACRKLQDGCERLKDWLAAVEADRGLLDSRRRAALAREVGAVKKALTTIGRADDTRGQGIDGAVARVVQDAVSALSSLIEGRELATPPQRLYEALDLPLMRLPGGCQPHTPQPGDPAFTKEREAQRDRLFTALQNPRELEPNERAAFQARCAEWAILPAHQLLDRMKQTGALTGGDAEAAEQALAEAEAAARSHTQNQVEALRLELATLYNLDLGTGDEVRQWLDRLDAVAVALAPTTASIEPRVRLPALVGPRNSDIPPDFPELRVLLGEIRSFRDGLRDRIVEDQRGRLERLIREKPEQAKAAQELSERLSLRDPVTAEDMIAQLQAGLPLGGPDVAEQDVFNVFFPGFVESVAGATPESLNRGLIDSALRDGKAYGPLDFSGLDVDARLAAALLIDRWRRAELAMKRPGGELRDALRQLMETLGFTSVSIMNDNQLIPARLRRVQMHSDPLIAGRWFLPPVFGSEAGGRYPVFLARPEVQDDQLATELGKAGRESPCLLLVFGRLSRQRREGFARRMHRDKQSVLLIDETQILFLATGSADRIERMVTCAAPFGFLQPYTTNAGNIPSEMFFGRRQEIDKIISRRSDGCLVYGGRQLGKSALLHHVRKLYDNPTSGARAFYLKIDVIGAHGTPSVQIWREICTVLAEEGIVAKGSDTPDAVIGSIRVWLGADPARRLLILLDETDAFLAAESRTGFPNLGRLKDLMEETARRFKVVFAGLHNVRRMAQAPNSPLVHLGDPICIGPLNTTAENSAAARRLVTAPMRAAGFDYAIPELAWDILARVNHFPSLVQVFCKALLEGLSNLPRPAGVGPRWRLARSQIFEGSSAQDINRQIRERFQWTLNLDPRYELIAKILAQYRLDRADGNSAVLRAGLSAEEIANETADWWPKGFDRLGSEDFRAFLDEMVDLGVLARYGARQDRFGLRSAQVAQMLGRREEIDDQIMRIHEKEPRVDYDATQFHRRITLDDPTRRSPFSDRALADLFDTNHSGVRIVVAALALWGPDLAERLRDLASNWEDRSGRLFATLHAGPVSGLRATFQRSKAARHVVILPAESGWNEQSIEWLEQQPLVRTGKVVPVCLAAPNWLAARQLSGSTKLHARIVTPRPWGEAMLRAWLDEFGLASLDERMVREELLEGSGGVPVLLEAARPMLERIVAAGIDPAKELKDWADTQRVSGEAAGLPVKCIAPLQELADLVGDGQEDFSTLQELFSTAWANDKMELSRLLRLFADLGLLRHGDPVSEGVALTTLGRLVARSVPRS
jgi:hypothetical protein